MTDKNSADFSGWRASFWPIRQQELKKFLPMMLILFLLSFDYNLLRAVKDTLVVTARDSGAEVIPFIKVWVMFPGAIGMTFLFTRLSNRFTSETVFYVLMGVFLAYFFLFLFVLYPAREILHPHVTADYLQLLLPRGMKGFVALFRNWVFTSFYVMAELWGNIVLFLLFWGFANHVTRMHEAGRFYALFGIGANLSGIAAGQISVQISQGFGYDAWNAILTTLVLLVLGSGLLALFIFRWMHKKVLVDAQYYDPSEQHPEDRKKPRLSVRASFRYIMKSPYLLCIAFIVVAYNVAINLVEVLWKDQMKLYLREPAAYNEYFSRVMMVIGGVATFTSLFLSSNAIRKLGWTITALLTPMIVLGTSAVFFFVFFANGSLAWVTEGYFGMTPLGMVVFLGAAQNVLCRAAKYTVYDATKEMAFVPLSRESKLKGKAAIDGVCSRLGKSGGSVIHQSLLLIFSSLSASAPFVAMILVLLIIAWAGATQTLGKLFHTVSTKTQKIPVTA